MGHHWPAYHSLFLHLYIIIVKYSFRRYSGGTGVATEVLATWKVDPMGTCRLVWTTDTYSQQQTTNTYMAFWERAEELSDIATVWNNWMIILAGYRTAIEILFICDFDLIFHYVW